MCKAEGFYLNLTILFEKKVIYIYSRKKKCQNLEVEYAFRSSENANMVIWFKILRFEKTGHQLIFHKNSFHRVE